MTWSLSLQSFGHGGGLNASLRDKTGLERYTTEVEANELKLLDRQENLSVAVAAKSAFAVKERAVTTKTSYQPAFVDEDSDIPF